eukprot:g47153.t1
MPPAWDTDAELPALGLGTSHLNGLVGEKAVLTALQIGYRLLDCAKAYGNERHVGQALRAAVQMGVCSREEVIIMSKVWNDDHRPHCVANSCRQSLSKLGLAYLDVLLVHWPVAWQKGTVLCPDTGVTMQDTWKAMEDLVDQGLVRAIGVSNFSIQHLEQLLSFARIRPVSNQVELHPLLAQPELHRYCTAQKIRLMAWTPLGMFRKEVVHHPVIERIANSRQVNTSQLILAWHISRQVIALPKSSSAAHLHENFQALQLAPLTAAEMQDIASIDKHKRLRGDILGVFERQPPPPLGWLPFLLRTLGRTLFFFFPHVLNFTRPQQSSTELFLPVSELNLLEQCKLGLWSSALLYYALRTLGAI